MTRRLLSPRGEARPTAEQRVTVVEAATAPSGRQTVLERRRSRRYLELAGQLDAGSATDVDVSALAAAIAAEFGVGAELPLGLLSRCHLGAPYEVHVLDVTGGIVEHYAAGQPLPTPYAGARRLALHPSYLAIEVYRDRYVCLRGDGTATSVSS